MRFVLVIGAHRLSTICGPSSEQRTLFGVSSAAVAAAESTAVPDQPSRGGPDVAPLVRPRARRLGDSLARRARKGASPHVRARRPRARADQLQDRQTSAFQRSPSLFPIPDGSSNPPSWQLDHLPSAPPPPPSPFAAVPIPIPEAEHERQASESPNKESLEAAVADFNGSFMAAFLESPSPQSRARIAELKGAGLGLGAAPTGVFVGQIRVGEVPQDGDETDSEHGRDGADDDDDPFELSSDSEAGELQITHIAPSSLSSHPPPISYARSPSRSLSPPPRPEPLPLPPPPMRSFAPPTPAHSAPLAFIPALTRARGAHLSKAYENESDLRLDDPDSSDDPNALSPLPTRTRTRKSTKRRSSPTEPPRGRSRSSLPSVRRSTSSVSASSSTLAGPSSSLKRTEQPAVEDDPSIRPYGCCYPSCIERNRRRALRPPNDDDDSDEQPTSWRTIREMREHCAAHKKAGEVAGETPFRCALDPCGKTFKVRPRTWHPLVLSFLLCADHLGRAVGSGPPLALHLGVRGPLLRLARSGRGPPDEKVQGRGRGLRSV